MIAAEPKSENWQLVSEGSAGGRGFRGPQSSSKFSERYRRWPRSTSHGRERASHLAVIGSAE